MKTTTRTIALRVIGTVVAGFLMVGVTAGAADAAPKSGSGTLSTTRLDTGW